MRRILFMSPLLLGCADLLGIVDGELRTDGVGGSGAESGGATGSGTAVGGHGGASSAVGGAASTAYEASVSVDAPVLWWRLDGEQPGTAVDELRMVNGRFLGGYMQGQEALILGNGKSALVGNTGSIETIGNSFGFGQGAHFTLEAWIQPTFLNMTFVRLFDNVAGPIRGENGYRVALNDSEVQVTFFANGVPGSWGAALEAPFPIDMPTHVVVTYGDAGMCIHVNGRLEPSDSGGSCGPQAQVNNSSAPLVVGGGPFSGLVDEVSIYDKALSIERILAHYNAGKP